ncbi:hypothetical protein SAMN02745146_0904 [Hymenobacter daecheongensis DSM 21074]|uniref:Uncharacterized protein n=2 Tax=Hymenobacter daecheongensis TaxID=496053 RepID=A0A1M6B7W1_9BACT|nr:hypothetical protein SAMN02745146_0904 [Hymenobacter daecheongensis DSM 21074]
MSTVTTSSRPYVSRRKRRRSSSLLTSAKLRSKAIMGLFGLLVLALLVSLSVIAFTVGRNDATTSADGAGVAATPAAADSGGAPVQTE